jgi:hypothetical protein
MNASQTKMIAISRLPSIETPVLVGTVCYLKKESSVIFFVMFSADKNAERIESAQGDKHDYHNYEKVRDDFIPVHFHL